MKKYLFGWTNIRFVIVELVKLGSHHPSYFSKKRIDSLIALGIGHAIIIIYFIKSIQKPTFDVYDACFLAAVEFSLAGYTINLIQKEKKEVKSE